MSSTGKVYLVGAGPGHPELLTLKAAELLKAADVIVYDRLIQQEVLALTRSSAERIYMGKAVDRHESRQQEVNDLLVRRAREGKLVVRLKGGDPFLFGRGGEEAEYLAAHGVAFEVIPGVCSALSAPLSAGIPVTHRDYASSLAIVTGHQCKDKDLDWNALARIDTLVVLMGVHNLAEIAARLMAAGRSPATPAAIIQMAFWHGEQTLTATLATIADEAKRAAIQPPATVVIGEVIRLREKLYPPQRDLARPSGVEGFAPGPGADQLFRIAGGSLASQVLAWALRCGIFDQLEQPAPVCDVAHALGLNAEALNDVMEVLVAMGLVEARNDGYRNLELASRYLVSHAAFGLRSSLLYELALTSNCDTLAAFVRDGRKPQPSYHSALQDEAAEALARFAVLSVVQKLALPQDARVLFLGWGAAAYRFAIAKQWPQAQVSVVNPVRGGSVQMPRQSCHAVIISGVLNSLPLAEGEQVLAAAAAALKPGGIIAVHDELLRAGAGLASEKALARLARRIAGAPADWSLERLEAACDQLSLRLTAMPVPSAGTLALARHVAEPAESKTSGALAASTR